MVFPLFFTNPVTAASADRTGLVYIECKCALPAVEGAVEVSMELLSALSNPDVWQKFYEHKLSGGHLNRMEETALQKLVEQREYLSVAERIQGGGTFAPPRKKMINKHRSGKKRIVYIYEEKESWVLKLLTWLLLRRFNDLFADNLYSFRPGAGAKDAIRRLTHTPGIRRMWSYKVDISNYFNSIPIPQLLPLMRNALADVPETCAFLESLLTNPLVNDRGTLVAEEKGIMAGTAVSTFLANLYLSHMDHYFSDAGTTYARYSDDVIVFAQTEEQLEEHIGTIHRFLEDAGLEVNPDKEERAAPGEAWNYLGVSFHGGTVDISPVSVSKLKAKMRRKTRALLRWRARKGLDGVRAAKAFVNVFNRKLFENPAVHELTWTRWYFPLINTAESLRVIDAYSQYCIRTLATGKRNKSAYNFRYEDIKALGYRSLVNSYYRFEKEEK